VLPDNPAVQEAPNSTRDLVAGEGAYTSVDSDLGPTWACPQQPCTNSKFHYADAAGHRGGLPDAPRTDLTWRSGNVEPERTVVRSPRQDDPQRAVASTYGRGSSPSGSPLCHPQTQTNPPEHGSSSTRARFAGDTKNGLEFTHDLGDVIDGTASSRPYGNTVHIEMLTETKPGGQHGVDPACRAQPRRMPTASSRFTSPRPGTFTTSGVLH